MSGEISSTVQAEALYTSESQIDLTADRPIEKRLQDRLQRRKFAESMANAIAKRYKRDSFVIALQGPWGCGKSSIKNMILDAFEEEKEPPIVVDFAPWQLRDADTLFSAFFHEIALAIGKQEGEEASRKRLESYSNHLAFGGTSLKALGALGGIIGVPGAKIAEAIGEKMGEVAKASLEGAELIEEKSIKEIKNELKESLKDLARPLLVVIDDIDRLEVDEMMMIFQLVKANADFPNFTYLLLLQRDAVEAAIIDKMGPSGQGYLEKVIQLPIDVPRISESQRYKLFRDGLIQICSSWNASLTEEQLDETDMLWENGLRGMLLYPRDVQRILNVLEFSLSLMRGTAGWEIDVPDFIGLEALRIQEPKLYHQLPRVKSLLTGFKPPTTDEVRQRYGFATKPEESGEDPYVLMMKSVQSCLSVERRDAARNLLAFMFPRAIWAFEEKATDQSARPTKRPEGRTRVKDIRYFDRYFALSIPEDQLSEEEMQTTIAKIGNYEEFVSDLNSYLDRDLLWLFLSELSRRLSEISEENYAFLLSVIFELGEKEEGTIGLFGYPIEVEAYQIFSAIMSKLEIEDRGKLLISVTLSSNSLVLPIRWYWGQETENEKDNQRADRWATDEQLAEMAKIICKRIENADSNQQLQLHHRVQLIVRFWSQFNIDAVKGWLSQQLQKDNGIKFFLSQFRNDQYVLRDPPTLYDVKFSKDVFDWINDINDIKERVEKTDTSEWEVIDRLSAEKFIKTAEYLIEETLNRNVVALDED